MCCRALVQARTTLASTLALTWSFFFIVAPLVSLSFYLISQLTAVRASAFYFVRLAVLGCGSPAAAAGRGLQPA